MMRKGSSHYALWYDVVDVLALFTFLQGASFVYSPTSKTYSPSFYIIRRVLPGGIHTFGAIMLIAAFLFLLGVTHGIRLTKLALRFFVMLCFAVSFTIVCSWVVFDKQPSPASLSVWLAFGAIGGILILKPPIPKGGDDA